MANGLFQASDVYCTPRRICSGLERVLSLAYVSIARTLSRLLEMLLLLRANSHALSLFRTFSIHFICQMFRPGASTEPLTKSKAEACAYGDASPYTT